MVNSSPAGWIRVQPDSWLGRLLGRRVRHPDEFDCAIRVLEGEVPGESARWRYRRSAVDQLVTEDLYTGARTITVNRGPLVHLRVRFTGPSRPGSGALRPGHLIWPAVVDEGTPAQARVEIAADRDVALERLFVEE